MPLAHFTWLLPGYPQSLEFPAGSGLLELSLVSFLQRQMGAFSRAIKTQAVLWARGLIQLPVMWRKVTPFWGGGTLGERQKEGPSCRKGTVTLPMGGDTHPHLSSEVSTRRATSGRCLCHGTDACLLSLMFSQCYLVLLKQAINSVIWVCSVPFLLFWLLTSI